MRCSTATPAAYDRLDRVVRENVLPNGIVRVKLWRPDGTVVYADERRLVGQRFSLGDEQRDTLEHPQTRAEVSDLARSENEFERYGGKLLEVYRPVWTPSGAELLFEVYGDYQPVQDRAFDLWRGLAGVLASSLLLLLVLMAPIIWRLLDRLQAAQQQREALLRRAVDASDGERRRIAADLHDGPVQDLVGSSLAVSGAAEAARADGRDALATTIAEAGSTVRASVASLRSLLVDIYPARLADAGLAAAINDLARPLEGRGIAVEVDVHDAAVARLTRTEQRVVHRVTRECLRNVVKHADATRVTVTLAGAGEPEGHTTSRGRAQRRAGSGGARHRGRRGGLRPLDTAVARGALRSARARGPRDRRRRSAAGVVLAARRHAMAPGYARRRDDVMTEAPPDGGDGVRTTVVVVDDHRLVRAGLRTIIDASEDLEVVGEAGDGSQAVTVVGAVDPDVVLMDLSMPGVDGIEAIRRLRTAGHHTPVVVLTSFAEPERVRSALEAGAVGYLLKDSEPRDVLEAVRAAVAGHAPLDPRVTRALLPSADRGASDVSLSGREREVLFHVAKGLPNKQIARTLGISERTVKVHLGNVFRRIGVSDRTSAALWARDHGIS